jgi:hypothetical protein
MSVKRTAVAVILTALALTGCSKAIEGQAFPVGGAPVDPADGYVAQGDEPGRQFRNLLTECDTVTDEEIMKAVDSTAIERIFFGAICRWDLSGSSGNTKVTFNWFEIGSLEVERTTLEKLKYTITDITIQGRRAIQMQRPGDPDSCGVTAGAPDQGIIGWWVQFRPGSPHPDPCAAAVKLTELTLNVAR